MSKLKMRGILTLGILAFVPALARPAVAAEDAVAARIKAGAAIQSAREAVDALVKAREEAVAAPVGRHAESSARRQQHMLDRANQELERASAMFEAGDHARAQRFAEKAARFAWRATAPQSPSREKGGR